jgi:hypothetical protein
VISIEKTGENFRLIYDVKGRFCVHRITAEEAKVGLEHNREIDGNAKLMLDYICTEVRPVDRVRQISTQAFDFGTCLWFSVILLKEFDFLLSKKNTCEVIHR